jgi:hypothetical protein
MITKICSKCHKEKNICEFGKYAQSKDGLLTVCKLCKKIINLNYRNSDPVKYKEKQKKYRNNNKSKEKIRIQNWREKNKKKVNLKSTKYEKYRKEVDPQYKLIRNVRTRLYNFLKSKNISKKNKTIDIIGCDSFFLKNYLESKFTENMSWGNFGKEIHIDHIIPLSSAKNEEEVLKLCHYTNLQPLWSYDNLKKGSKLI